MTESQFDPQLYLDAAIAEPSIKRPPLPAGAEFVGTIKEPKPREWKGRKDPTQSGVVIDVPIEIDLSTNSVGADYIAQGILKVTLTDGVMLEMTPNKMIDNGPGKNRRMRQYREALDLNKPGDSFNWRMCQERQIRVKIKHEAYEGEMYDKIDSVARV